MIRPTKDVHANSYEDAANRFANRLESYPEEVKWAVILIAENVLNGCGWEFTRNTGNELTPDLVEKFRNSNVCGIQEVTYNHKRKTTGYLVSMKFDALVELLRKEGEGVFNKEDLDRAVTHRSEAITKLVNTLEKASVRSLRVGIYCTNDSSTITIDGNSFPAFAVDLPTLLMACEKTGWKIRAGEPRTPAEVAKKADAFIKNLTVAPSSNALMINLCR